MSYTDVFSSFFSPSSIAFIGASKNLHKWGFNILHHIVKGGYSGALYPVNPNGGTWYGIPVYPSLRDIPGAVDLAIIVVPAEMTPDAMRECAAKKIPAVVIITAGFSEAGASGKALEKQVVQIAHEAKIRIVGPNTMGIFSGYPSRINAIMGATPLKPGRVGVISQSGNLGTSIAHRLNRREIGLSRLISSGNEADLTVEEYLEYLEHDEQTSLICLYIEGVRNGRSFFSIAKRISRTKPILLLKGGTSASGAHAAMSHTGAIAGDAAIFGAMCAQTGIIQVDSIDEMVDIAGILLSQPEMKGNKIGIITQGGGWGVLATDLCARYGFELEPLTSSLVEKLDAILPPFWSRRNPIDLVAPGRVTVITDTIRLLVEHSNVDAVLLLGLGYMTIRARRWMQSTVINIDDVREHAEHMISEEMKLMKLIVDQVRGLSTPVIPVIDQVAFDEIMDNNPVKFLDSSGIMAYSSPEYAIRALSRAAWYYERQRARQ